MQRSFHHFWLSVGLSNLADGFLVACIPLTAIALTDSTLLIAIIGAAMPTAAALGGIYSAALVDRVDRVRALVLVNLLRSLLVVLLTLAFVGGWADVGLLLLVLVGLGLLEITFDSTYIAVVPTLVAVSSLDQVNGRLQVTQNVANDLIGPTLVASLILLGLASVYGATAGIYIISASLLFLLLRRRSGARPARTPPPYWESIKEALRYIRSQVEIKRLLIASIAMNIAIGAFGSVYVIYVISEVALSKSQFSLLLTASAVGALLGVLVIEKLPASLGRLYRLTLAACLITISTLVTVTVPRFWGLYAAGALFGVGLLIWNTLHYSLRQRIIPNQLLVRVQTALTSMAIGLLPLGALLGGGIAQATSVHTLYIMICLYQFMIASGLGLWALKVTRSKAGGSDSILM